MSGTEVHRIEFTRISSESERREFSFRWLPESIAVIDTQRDKPWAFDLAHFSLRFSAGAS